MRTVVIIILLLVLVAFSCFFSGSEIVYARVSRSRLKREAEEGNVKAQNAWHMALNYNTLISTILVGNNLVNIAASSLATILFTEIWDSIGALYGGIIITFIILVFGEILPKTLFPTHSHKLAISFTPLLKGIRTIFIPLVWPISKLMEKMAPLWTPKEISQEEKEDMGADVLELRIKEAEEEGFIDNETAEIVTNTIQLRDTIAQEVMIPRVDVVCFDINDNISELMNDEGIFTYSRVVIYDDKIDNIKGVLNTKKLILKLLARERIDIKSLLTQPIYVHKTKSLTAILKEFKETKTHIAIVVDEFGGFLGIITLEDVLEEIVGDIWDEMDEVHEDVIKHQANEFIIDGDMNIEDMFEEVGFEEEDFDSEYDTVGGWCTEVIDDFPKIGDKFSYKNLDITILKVDGFRVEEVKVVVNEEEKYE